MSDTTKTKKFTFSQSTALVYAGAALLVLVVGIRSIFLTSDELGLLSYFTLGAVLVETVLLLYYAYTIYYRKEESESDEEHTFQLDMSSMENKIDELNQSIKGLNDKILNIENLDTEIKIDSLEFENTTTLLVNSMDTLGKDISSLSEVRIYNLQKSFSELTDSINAQNKKIDKLISRQINEEIRSEITSLLQKSLKNEN